MKTHLRARARARSLVAIPPSQASAEYSAPLAKAAASILYKSPIPSPSGHAVYVLNAAALPDAAEVDYDTLLPYVLARLPGEDDLVNGAEYEVVFFAGAGATESVTAAKKARPGWGWFFQAYHVLTRAMRKRIQKLYIVHERTWVRVLAEMFSTVVSPKFRKKIVHGKDIFGCSMNPFNLFSLKPHRIGSAYANPGSFYTNFCIPTRS
jgi:Rho GTPase-activating protein 1